MDGPNYQFVEQATAAPGEIRYVPGDEYRYPQYTKRGPFKWECCVLNKYVGYGRTRDLALAAALENQANGIDFRSMRRG